MHPYFTEEEFFAELERRRNDEEFMNRLTKRIKEDKELLERLRDDDR